MSACIACRAAPQPRASLSYKATTVIAVITAMTFAASGAAPTTLYQRYQEVFGLTPFILTVIFGAYVLSLLGASAHRRLAVGLYRPPPGDPRGVGPQRRRHDHVHLGGFCGGVDCRPRRARLRHGPRHRNARRRDHGHRPQPRAGVEQHHRLHRPDRRQPGRRCAGHLRARSAAARLCRVARPVGRRSADPLVHAGDRHAEARRARVASASCQHSGPRRGARSCR